MFKKLLAKAISLVKELWEIEGTAGADKLAKASENLYLFVEENDHKLFGVLPPVLHLAAVAVVDICVFRILRFSDSGSTVLNWATVLVGPLCV